MCGQLHITTDKKFCFAHPNSLSPKLLLTTEFNQLLNTKSTINLVKRSKIMKAINTGMGVAWVRATETI